MNNIWNVSKRNIGLGFVLATITSLVVIGCSDGSQSNSTSNNAGGGGSGNGGSGGGGGGGQTLECLDESTYADLLTINDSGFCVVALYDADAIGGSISWGRHGGPMFVEAGDFGTINGAINITRLTPPNATTGKLTAQTTAVDINANGGYIGGQVIDLPFFNWTAVSYTNPDPLSSGEIVLLDGATEQGRYDVNGFYGAATVGAKDALGRLVYSGRSPLVDNADANNALYAADACGAVGNNPRLIPEGDMTCGPSFAIEAFGDYSGPVAADDDGNVFAVMSNASGDQEAKGYAADTIKRGSGTTTGESLFKMNGYAGALAAVTPDGTGTGVLLFQGVEYDATAMAEKASDVIAQRYSVEGGKVVPKGVAGPFATPVQTGAKVDFTRDDQDRIWLVIPRANDVALVVAQRKF